MTDTILTQRGQALSLAVTYYQEEEGGDPVDLTGATVTVREANRVTLRDNMVVEVTDAAAGEVSLTLDEDAADGLGDGATNWFRLEAQWPDGSNRVSPKIGINVQ